MQNLDPFARFRLDDRVVVLTGASSGLGARFARVLDAAGAHVLLAARRSDKLEAVADTMTRGIPVACDVGDQDDRDRLLARAIDRFGHVDVLVNNAGTTQVVPALEEGVDDFRSVVEVNLVAPFALSRDAARAMVDHGGGVIVNVSSILGMVGVGQIPQSGYAAAKGGLINLTRELAAQWGRRGVRVNALAPGWFRSEMTDDMFEDERSMRWVARRTPLGRGGREGELDGALLFLASEASSYVTGQVLTVDGGWTAL